MRHLLTGLVVAAFIAVAPITALADNQEIATEIAKNLRDDAQLKDFKIGVKYQDGVVWLRGRVSNDAQMSCALRTVFQTPSVQRIVNGLTTEATAEPNAPKPVPVAPSAPTRLRPGSGALAPERPSTAQRLETVIAGGRRPASRRTPASAPANGNVGRAQRVANSFNQSANQAVAVSHQQRRLEASMAPRRMTTARNAGRPIPVAYTQAPVMMEGAQAPGGPIPAYVSATGAGPSPARYDQPNLPNYAWPSYSSYPNYASLTYPKQYSPTAWPFIGPFYPYPQVPLGWRKVTLEWDDGWWMLDFKE